MGAKRYRNVGQWRTQFVLNYPKQPMVFFKMYRLLSENTESCHFVIKSVRFQNSKFSEVAKMIYNYITDACSIILAPNLAIQSLEFDHSPCKLDKTTPHLPLWQMWTCWPRFDFRHACSRVQILEWNCKKVQNEVFSTPNLWIKYLFC